MKLVVVGHKFNAASDGKRTDGTSYHTNASVELYCIRKMVDPSYTGFATKSLRIKDTSPYFTIIQDRIGTGINGLYLDVDFDVNVINGSKFETVSELEILSSTPFARVVTDNKTEK